MPENRSPDRHTVAILIRRRANYITKDKDRLRSVLGSSSHGQSNEDYPE
jgi:hypothetical protein